jgi:hypothetical protein
MAAKQGLTAQLSQASEDAKRAVLSRTGVTSSWFSNLNTVCTIKSAPPRSPEVLQMLSTKSGWLFKRNEQHIWQARWCCVVPHTFLYYFDANVTAAGGNAGNHKVPQIPAPTAQQQEELNSAVQTGYANRKQHEKRSSLYLFNGGGGGGGNNNTNNNPNTVTIPEDLPMMADLPGGVAGNNNNAAHDAFFSSSQPAGIIDLECYTSVHRSTANPQVLELAGDDQVNPDLRNFYFCTNGLQDSEDWTDALLNGRHAALQDECEAYKQVCEGFAAQLQDMHANLDDVTVKAEENESELYRVRSHAEDVRRSCWRMVEESLVAAKINSANPTTALLAPTAAGSSSVGSATSIWSSEKNQVGRRPNTNTTTTTMTPTTTVQDEFLLQLEQVRSQDMGVPAAVRLLIQYTETIQADAAKMRQERDALQEQLQNAGQSDQARVQQLQSQLEVMTREYTTEKKQGESQMETLQHKCQTSQKELQDVRKDLSSTRMEVTMYQSQQKQKMAELVQHKKILKKEVIDLRSALDDAQSELAVLKHQQSSHEMRAEQERQKSQLLERYVDKMESQVTVQQNMMEMMSQSGSAFGGGNGGGSVYGAASVGNRSRYDSPRVVVVRAPEPSQEHHDDDIDDDDDDDDIDDDHHDDDIDDHDMDDHVDHFHDEKQEEDNVAEGLVPTAAYDRRTRSNQKRNNRRNSNLVDDFDNKSHMSELTEDQTQRHLEAFSRDYSPYQEVSPRMSRSKRLQSASPRAAPGPPSHIIGVNKDANGDDKKSFKQTINSAASLPAGPSTPPVRRREIPRASRNVDSMSVSSENRHRLSVAQRARLQADQQATPVRARLDEKTHKAIEKKSFRVSPVPPHEQSGQEGPIPTSNSSVQGSQQSGLWRRMEEVVLGPRSSDSESSDDEASVNSHTGDVQHGHRYSSGREADSGPGSRASPKARLKSEIPEEKKSMDDSVSVRTNAL